MKTIDLCIEELVLRDVPYELRYRIAEAVERELARLLSEWGLPPSFARGGMIPEICLDNVQMDTAAGGDIIGAQVAQQIYAKLAGADGRQDGALLSAPRQVAPGRIC